MLHDPPPKLYWCTSHQRLAEEVTPDGRHRCKYGLPGILLPCHAVEYTLNVAEINRLSQGSAKGDMKLIASVVLGQTPETQYIIPVLYKRKRKCTSS